MIKVSFIALSGLFVAFTQAAAFAQCLPQDGAVVEGTLVQGPKGSFLVELSDEACLQKPPGSEPPRTYSRKIHIIMSYAPALEKRARGLLGKRVEARGDVGEGSTVQHYTPIVMIARQLAPK